MAGYQANERWRPVVGYESRYEISNFGRLRSLPRTWNVVRKNGSPLPGIVEGKILKPRLDKDGYEQIGLRGLGERKWFKIHQLVLETFIGPRPKNLIIDHIDGNRANNALSNIHYISQSENMLRSDIRNGGRPWLQGDGNPMSKLDIEQVKTIRQLAKEGVPQIKIARQFNMGSMQISRIIRRQRWKWIEDV
jgi:NUMOD4 motif/HNH endonuclease